jgi:mannose-6-phosphate isomerase-like protein (cupin superfamily)
MPEHHWSENDIASQLPTAGEGRYVEPFRHGTLRLGYYAPRGRDPQQPHDQDEVYIVMRGSGQFVNGDERHRFGPGDALFVPAGVEHRFEEFSEDLALWVIFYGSPGGEQSG